ncbi:BatA domain-containing protein [Alteromonas gilva]|uniref:BatA domain-containing protein n=1 Tax=Alteromonas gilva TaxID=2987522 RepID=A0ABT5KZM8_9ALTE|nr:BatA domain-containing protein [Alteromonas gilva]MDC8830225.1 BatA domain-containing protein [Alteromonas gilva]
MSFVNLPWWLVLAGAFSLIALLVALQHLKARPVVMRVASVQLWQEALQQASANTLWQRFRHWLSFLVALLIALLLWLAISGIRFADNSETLHVYYLDTSVAMHAGDNMADAKAQLKANLASVSSLNRELWIGDAVPARILTTDTSSAVLATSFNKVRASSHVSAFPDWLEQLPELYNGRRVIVHYYGPAFENDVAPEGMVIQKDYVSAAISANAGITAIGQQRYMNNAQQVARVAFTLLSTSGKRFTPADFSVTLNDNLLEASRISALPDNQFIISDIALSEQPQRLTVSINHSDDFNADDIASITLPAQSRIFVALQSGLPEWVLQFVSANPQLTVDPDKAIVSICASQDTTCPDTGATVYADNSTNAVTFFTPHPQDEKLLRHYWQANHWPLQTPTSEMPILNVALAQSKAVSLPMEQLGTLVDNQRTDPLLLLSTAINWLADFAVVPPYLAIGETAPTPPDYAVSGRDSVSHYPLYGGALNDNGNLTLTASLQSPFVSEQVAKARQTSPSAMEAPESAFPWLTLMLLTVLGLLFVEWLMIQRGRWV